MKSTSYYTENPLTYMIEDKIKLPKPVDRVKYISAKYKDKTVLDIGALDETAYKAKIELGRSEWLHAEGSKIAKSVVGIDNSSLIENEFLKTSEKSKIVKMNVFDLKNADSVGGVNLEDFDIIIAGEIIEHMSNAVDFVKIFTGNDKFKGKTLIMSTPNALSFHNAVMGFAHKEDNHQDHLSAYTYKVLTTVITRAGVKKWRIIPTYSRFSEKINRSHGMVKFAANSFEKITNGAQWLFPIKSGGYIVEIKL